jgi:hypothetical protein
MGAGNSAKAKGSAGKVSATRQKSLFEMSEMFYPGKTPAPFFHLMRPASIPWKLTPRKTQVLTEFSTGRKPRVKIKLKLGIYITIKSQIMKKENFFEYEVRFTTLFARSGLFFVYNLRCANLEGIGTSWSNYVH